MIAKTDFPVPGPPSTINTLFSLWRCALIPILKASSNIIFWSSINTKSLFPFKTDEKESCSILEGLIFPFSMIYNPSLSSPSVTNFLIKSLNFSKSFAPNMGAAFI